MEEDSIAKQLAKRAGGNLSSKAKADLAEIENMEKRLKNFAT